MCIIMLHEAGHVIPEDHLDNSAFNHPHGCGLSFINGDRIIIKKEMKPDKFKDLYYQIISDHPKSPVIVHYRKMTDGDVDLANCHPFRIDKEHVFAHNGTIYPCKPEKDAKHGMSDTRMFNEYIMKNLPTGWFRNKGVHRLLDEYVGRSKLAVMRNDGKILIIGEKKGTAESLSEWDTGVWYSNQSYKSKRVEVVTHPIVPYDHSRADRYEWNDDGLRLKYNSFLKQTEAYDNTQFRWRSYIVKEGRFEFAPFSCWGHKPAKWKPFHATWISLDVNGDDIPFTKSTDDRECMYCRQVFNIADLEVVTFNDDKGQEMLELCVDCRGFLNEIKADTTLQKFADN